MAKKILFLIFLGTLILPSIVSAQLVPCAPGAPCVSFWQVALGVRNAAWIIFTVVALVCFVVSGILFLTAQGNPERLKLARYAVLGGVAGVVVGILAFGAITLVGSIF